MVLINTKQFLKVSPNTKPERAEFLVDKLNFCCPAYKINTVNAFEEFFVQVIHESGYFRRKEENLRYRRPELLVNNWPAHFKSVEFARQYTNNPRKLAEYIYGSTRIAKDLGNIKPEDGWNLRGSGFIQNTGRANGTAYAKYVGFSTPEEVMELMRTDDYWALDSACWFFAVRAKLIPFALKDDIKTVRLRTNGGTIGMKETLDLQKKVKEALNS